LRLVRRISNRRIKQLQRLKFPGIVQCPGICNVANSLLLSWHSLPVQPERNSYARRPQSVYVYHESAEALGNECRCAEPPHPESIVMGSATDQ
jgi:hypothetical protein